MFRKQFIVVSSLLLSIVACKKKEYVHFRSDVHDITAGSYTIETANEINSINLLALINSKECILGEDSAKNEAKRGKYRYTELGTVSYDGFVKFYSDYLSNNYGVDLYASCTGFMEHTTEDCFIKASNDEVLKKFGDDFMERTYVKALKLFKEKNK